MKALLCVLTAIAVAHFLTLIALADTINRIEKRLKDKQNESD